MYDTISVSRIMELVPFYSPYQIEKTIVESARNGAVQVWHKHQSDRMMLYRTLLNRGSPPPIKLVKCNSRNAVNV